MSHVMRSDEIRAFMQGGQWSVVRARTDWQV